MGVLILGSGGREHALGWAFRRDNPAVDLMFLPGNGGTSDIGRNLPGNLADLDSLVSIAREEEASLTVVGPEAPLVAGIVDRFRAYGLPIFGPTASAARLEGSKVFAKTLLRDHGIPTPGFDVCTDPATALRKATTGAFPKVLKADGLAAGKGVLIVRDSCEADAGVRALMESREFGAAGETVLIEEFATGEEVSCFAIARGEEYCLLPLSQDHKRIGEGDTGPNTGGMGAYAPYSRATPGLLDRIEKTIIGPVLNAMVVRGTPFEGLLYAGIIMVDGEPQVLEFNCRFGDPETQAVLPLVDAGLRGGGLLEAVTAVARGRGALPRLVAVPAALDGAAASAAASVAAPAGASVGTPAAEPDGGTGVASAVVVLASAGYPGAYETGKEIRGLEEAERIPGALIFHAGTRREGDHLVTSGGRVLGVTGVGPTLRDALDTAYAACDRIEFEGKTLRRDIGWRA